MAIVLNDAELREQLDKLSQALRSTRTVMDVVGRTLRDYTRNTIRLQGRTKPYAPLSAWTYMRTGRTEALTPLIKRITYAFNKDGVMVYFNAPSTKWNIQQHITGYTIPARIGRPVMRVPVLGGGAVYFRRARAAHVPGREVWPTEAEATAIVLQVVRDWVEAAQR